MSDLIDKLNLLVRARVNSALSGSGGAESRPSTPRRPPSDDVPLTTKEAEREIRDLRKHIDDALNAEDEMKRKIEAGQSQSSAYDQQADSALTQGQEDAARGYIQQMQRTERSIETLSTELDKHRRATSELIEQVNQLESILADQQASQTVVPTPAELNRDPITINVRRDASAPSSTIPIRVTPATPAAPVVPAVPAAPEPTTKDKIDQELDKAKVEDDLARRRARLSKPDGT